MTVICSPDQQEYLDTSLPNCAWFYGNLQGGNKSNGYKATFDFLPHNMNEVNKINRKRFQIHEEPDEPIVDEVAILEMEQFNEEWDDRNLSAEQISENKFKSQSPEEKLAATTYTVQLDKKDDENKIK